VPEADAGRLIELSVYCIPQEDEIIGANRGEAHRHERPEQVLSLLTYINGLATSTTLTIRSQPKIFLGSS
jgi:hypothetical protein